MMTMKDIQKKLRKNNSKNYTLYAFCNFISLMLITAYSAMMFSPTVLAVLPDGGDSRKQVMAIFALACVGCVVFTIYAAGLFFRKKSKEIGTMMALGASKKRLAPGMISETVTISGLSALAGTAAGIPFAWLVWQAFRLAVVDSAEMRLVFNFSSLWVSVVFMVLVIGSAAVLAVRYLNRTNILDVIHEEHQNEPVRSVGRKCGIIGIIVLLFGAMAGYFSTGIYMRLFSAYPPAWINLLYVPVIIGLYMILLHTVVNGWRQHKNSYKGLIARSMMKFQGKQTVNNMLVVTVLIAGACFAMFYIPMMGTGQVLENNNRPYDYSFRYPVSNDFTSRQNVEALAEKEGLAISDYKNASCITLGMDGEEEVEDKGNKYHMEHREFYGEGRFLSASAFTRMTGMKADVDRGEYWFIGDDDGNSLNANNEAKVLTNMATMEQFKTICGGNVSYGLLYGFEEFYVLNDEDYAEISKGLTAQWKEGITFFNVPSGDNYQFANSLYRGFINSLDDKYATATYYDRVSKYGAQQRGETYWGDTDAMTELNFDRPDSTEFRQYWTYMPKIRALDQNDFMKTFAVFLMMFLFIAIICMLSALVICYTRCLTIAINNRYVFDDLKRLGASPKFLNKELRNQAGKVFSVPAIVGMAMMYLLYGMIMYANDSRFSPSDVAGLGVCLAVVALFAAIIYIVYRTTLSKMRSQLGITKA